MKRSILAAGLVLITTAAAQAQVRARIRTAIQSIQLASVNFNLNQIATKLEIAPASVLKAAKRLRIDHGYLVPFHPLNLSSPF